MWFILMIGILSFVICIITTPFVIKFANKCGFVDIPKDSRRVHTKPMPRIGGLAMVISIYVSLFIYYILTRNIDGIAFDKKIIGFILGSLSIATMGFIDDAITLKARYKSIFEIMSAIFLYIFGVKITGLSIPFMSPDVVSLGWLEFPITLIWVLSVTNALNLIDGLDGLSAGIASISSASLLIIFVTTSVSLEAIVITAVLLGATLGFLPYNFNPAKTFMGDVGSNFLGFILATVSMMGFAEGYSNMAVMAPILAIFVPLFDTVFAMLRRILKGQPPLRPDGAHIHHRLIKRGFTQRQAVLILYTITSICSIIAILVAGTDIGKTVLLSVASICFIVIGFLSIRKSRRMPRLVSVELNKEEKEELNKENENKENGEEKL